MAWTNAKKTSLVELLKNVALLHSKIVELQIKQKCVRARQQIGMANALRSISGDK